MTNARAGAKRAVARVRGAWPWFDHLGRAWERYRDVGGNRLSAALTTYAILALLPLLLVAMSVLGFVLAHDPDRQRQVFDAITGTLPGVGSQLREALGSVEENRATTGALGLAGLLWTGLGGIDALRDALRIVWHERTERGPFLKRKALDVLTVAATGLVLAMSFALSALAAGAGSVPSFVLGVAVDVALFLVLFTAVPRVGRPWRRLLPGAVFGGVAFAVLKVIGGWYVGHAAARSTALYGSIGTAVAVLVGLYLVCRVVLFTAAWTATGAGWDASPRRPAERRLTESRA